MEDLSIETFEKTLLGKLLKPVLKHPYNEMYKRKDFYRELKRLGFSIEKKYENGFWFSLVAKKR